MNNAEMLTLMAILATSDKPTNKIRRGKVMQEEQEVKPAWKPSKPAISPAEYRRLHKGKVSNG